MNRTLKRVALGVAIAGTLAAGSCAVDLFVVPHGLNFTGPDSLSYNIRPNSWVTRVTGAQGTTIGHTIHLKWPRDGVGVPTSCGIAHEWRHIYRRRHIGPATPLFEIKYQIWPSYAEMVERQDQGWARLHCAEFERPARFLSERVVVE